MEGTRNPFKNVGGSPQKFSTKGFPLRRELIVVTKQEAQVRARAEGVTSLAGMDTAPLATLLQTEGATMLPLFGMTEERLMAETAAAAVPGTITPNLALYYHVDAPDEKLDSLAEKLLTQTVVQAAYVKPAAELAVVTDVEIPEDVATEHRHFRRSTMRNIPTRARILARAVGLLMLNALLSPALSFAGAAAARGGAVSAPDPWIGAVSFTNQVASAPAFGGGYPIPPGSRVPLEGTCRPGPFNANHSESWIAVKPGTEDLVGSAKFFFDKFSTFYMFYLGALQIPGGTPISNNQIQGYDCVSTGTQLMPPSWTDTTDPNLGFDTQGRVYQTVLPFNAFWDASTLHPDGAIDMSFSDDLGQHWAKGNGGFDLEQSPNASARQVGHVEDKQWVAVNHIAGNRFQDHVYAAWSIFDGSSIKVRIAVSRDRGQSFANAVTVSPPSQVGPAVTFILPQIDAAGSLYVAFVAFPPNDSASTIFVARSDDDGQSFTPFVPVTTVNLIPTRGLPNTRFRDGITETFAASPTHAGHLYLAYEDWNGTDMNIKFTQSVDGGSTWSTPVQVNDNVDAAGVPTDQFQPTIAAGPNGAVAIGFYDRRRPCPNDASVLPADVGRTNFCIDVSLQVYKDGGSGAAPVGANVRITQFTWDPEQPGQHLGGLSQYPCAGARDPCPSGTGFIGDFFGLTISSQNIYALFVSTHYPSTATADEGGPIYYQQQVLATVKRSKFGAGF